MARLPSFQFYPDDWLSDAALRSCSLRAKGLWMDLLCYMHQGDEYGLLLVKGRPWRHDDVCAAVGADERDVRAALDELLAKGVSGVRTTRIKDDSGAIREVEVLFSRRMVRDAELRKVRQKAGSKGGKARFSGLKQTLSKSQANGQAKLKQTPEEEDEEVVSRLEKGGSKGGKYPPAEVEEIYAAYPRHVGAGAAKKAIRAALSKINPPDLLLRVQAYAASRKGQDSQFTPHPATWFNQERWNDEIEAIPSGTCGGNGVISQRTIQLNGPSPGEVAERERERIERANVKPASPEAIAAALAAGKQRLAELDEQRKKRLASDAESKRIEAERVRADLEERRRKRMANSNEQKTMLD